MDLKLFMTCPRGFEQLCLNELESFGAINCVKDNGGVHFLGSLESIYKLNYNCKHGMTLLWEIFSFEVNSIDDLYNALIDFTWDEYISIVNTFSVQIRVKESDYIQNSHFAKLKVKDAIVDYFKNKYNNRPNVSISKPDIPINIFIHKQKVKVYLNSSGDPLFKRNYRTVIHKAALNEVYASSLIKLSEWSMNKSLVDPMCGSGTIPIEASMIIHNIPSGYLRDDYAFMHWLNFKPRLLKTIINESNNNIVCNMNIDIFGSDIYEKPIKLFNSSISKFDINMQIKTSTKHFKFANYKNSHIITNPPYGIRIGDKNKLENMYKSFECKILSQTDSAFMIVEDSDCLSYFESNVLKISQVMNGNIKCCFIKISI